MTVREVCDDIDDVNERLDNLSQLSLREQAMLATDIKIFVRDKLVPRVTRAIEWDEIERLLRRMYVELLKMPTDRADRLLPDEMEWLRGLA